MRFGLAYAIIPTSAPSSRRSSFALARMTFSAPIGDNQSSAGERTVVHVPSVSADYRIWRFFAGADVGARVRPATEFSGAKIGTQLTAAAGAGFEILPGEALRAA